jgi:hypothetical protein
MLNTEFSLKDTATKTDKKPAGRSDKSSCGQYQATSAGCLFHGRGELINFAQQFRQLEGAEPFEVYIDDDESADPQSPHYFDRQRLLRTVFGPFREVIVYGGVGERTVSTITVEAGINVTYMRALAKVAFHYFLWSQQVLRGNEPVFANIRNLIATGAGDYRAFVDYDAPQFIPILREGLVPVRTSHYFFAELTRDRAVSWCQFFVGPTHLSPPARVRLAATPLRLDASVYSCHQACFFDDEADRRDGHQGELIIIDVTRRRIITASD